MSIDAVTQKDKSVFGEDVINTWALDGFAIAAFSDRGFIRLDIARSDLSDGITWDELMEIKNLCGYGDKDAIELYPRDRDVLNTGNVRHLYVSDTPLDLVRRLHNGWI